MIKNIGIRLIPREGVLSLHDDVYLDKLQTRGIKKSILYM
jgi:hypothetical protein